MSEADSSARNSGGPQPNGNSAAVPEGLVQSVVDLVETGPVLLGAYTVAELTAVDAIVDFLEARPPDEVLAEAVRSLAARELLVASEGEEQMQVRGDLGIAVAFQQRARKVLDARTSGTRPGEPWRMLMLPQPEPITLMVKIDALGIHDLGLFPAENALDQLVDWLPGGDYDEQAPAVDAASMLESTDRSSLVTVTEYTAQGSAEVAGESADIVLAAQAGDLRAYTRNPADRSRLAPSPLVDGDVKETIARLLAA